MSCFFITKRGLFNLTIMILKKSYNHIYLFKIKSIEAFNSIPNEGFILAMAKS